MEHGAARAAVPLFGVPVAVKVNIDVAGMVTTAACASFAYTASVDVGVVRQLKQAGRVVMGKCNLDQFATGLVGVRLLCGVVPNTFDKSFVCGGSSSGSASVVARGLVRWAPTLRARAGCLQASTGSSQPAAL